MNFRRFLFSGLAAATLGLAGGAARAQDNIYWSVGISSPGVHVGVGSMPPVAVYPPVYVRPYPVVVMPQPVIHPRIPVYYGEPPGWHHRHGHGHGHGGHGFGHGRGHGHGHHGGHGRHY